MATSPIPILVAITLPVDQGSLQPLLDMGRDATWQLHLLHAAPPPRGYTDAPGVEQTPEQREYELGLYVLNEELVRLGKWFEDFGVHVVFRLEEGPIVETILSMADDIDAQMIVIVGQRHRVGQREVLGSVATTLLRTASRPMLVLPTPRGAETGDKQSDAPAINAAVDRLLEVIGRSASSQELNPSSDLVEIRDAAQSFRDHQDSPQRSENRLLRSLHRFETDHPSFTRAISDVAYYLSGTGI